MISIVIPVVNEEKVIKKVLDKVTSLKDVEIIVVDGGSEDRTMEIVQQYPVRLVQARKGRAAQMNEGAQTAKGDILVFLHSDCFLEDNSIQIMREYIDSGFVGGCFRQKIEANALIYRFIEWSGNLRARVLKMFYGDQAIFVRKDMFDKIGGFDNVELFDDVLFSRKLKKHGRVGVLQERVTCSPRRWQKQGVIQTSLINWLVTLGFMFGVSPDRLKKIYQDVR